MALSRRSRWALGLASLIATGLPAVLLLPPLLVTGEPLATGTARARRPLAPPPLPALTALYRRPLFGRARAAAAPADAPALLGIAGRIDADAVAIVRTGDGDTRTLRPGDSIDGWRLEALAADAASFVRGAETVRVPIAGGADPPGADGEAADGQAADGEAADPGAQ